MPRCRRAYITLALALASVALPASAQGWHASLSPLLGGTQDRGPAPRTDRHRVVVALALRNRDALEAFLADVQDPLSPRFHRFLTQAEFNALYAPAVTDEEAVVSHLAQSGLTVTERAANRLLVGAEGSVAALERAFGVAIHAVDLGGRRHYAAIEEPSLPARVADAVVGVIGLDDLAERHPHLRAAGRVAAPKATLGSHCCALGPDDLAAFYDDGASYDGGGETIAIAGAYAWKDTDNTGFDAQWGLPPLPAGSGQVCTGPANSAGCKFSNQQSIEIALDVEYAHGTAPGARILNYMSASTSNTDFTTMYNRIVTDDAGHVVTTSWGTCEPVLSPAQQAADDAIVANANAIGQSWFAASGDSGSLDCSNTLSVDEPASSPHVIGVGGTTPACSAGMTPASPACAGYGSEAGWSGSGGGVSTTFARPPFQVGCGVPAGTQRLVPDVALEADPAPGNYVLEAGTWFVVAGTSVAAPQWAGYLAQLDQRAGGAGFGNPGALLYGLCGTGAYHDVVSGSNGDYTAGPGYDMVTGLGTMDANTFFALAVPNPSTTSSTTSPTTSSTTSTASIPSTSSSTTTITTPSLTTTSTTAPPTTTLPISTTSTSTPSTSSTATSSTGPTTTTTTTIPACPPDGFPGLRCALASGLTRHECAGDALPRALERRFRRATRLIDRAEAARRRRNAARLVVRVAAALGRSASAVERGAARGAVSHECARSLSTMLDDGRRRAQRLAASL